MISKRINFRSIIILFASFIGLELISFLVFKTAIFLMTSFLIVSLLVLIISIYRIKWGLFLILLELIVGSKGYLLFWPISDSNLLSIRIVIWSIFMLVFAIKLVWQIKSLKKDSPYLLNIKNFPLLKPYLYLAGTLVLGLVSALIYQNNILNIFLDFNNWLYFLLIFPLIAIKPSRKDLSNILMIGAIWLSLKTIILLAIFSHNTFTLPVYEWLRKTLVGEMTMLEGGWNRIFIQSQSFVAIAYLFLLAKSHSLSLSLKKINAYNYLLVIIGGLFFSTIVLSLSRSFWLGLVFSTLALLVVIALKFGYKNLIRPFTFVFLSVVIGLAFILIALPGETQSQLDNQLANRVTGQDEAAIGSRWSLLRPLLSEIIKNPVTGQGFGATVTYISQDPRVLEEDSSGVYTTYAFEWGYLDIWLKIGAIGLIAYLYLLWLIIRKSYILGRDTNDNFYFAIFASILFLVVVHFFTPYLNHPLGIGFIVASSCLIYKNKVY